MFSGIQETLQVLTQRIIALETQNQQLLQKTASLDAELQKCIIDTESMCAVGFMDNILIGFCRNLPILAHKDNDLNQLWTLFCNSGASHGHGYFLDCEFIFESLKHFKNAYYDPAGFTNMTLIERNRSVSPNSIRKSSHENTLNHWDDSLIQSPEVINMYKLCKEYGIKFKIHGEDRYNGVPIKLLFEDF
jgi:hypothetical protein